MQYILASQSPRRKVLLKQIVNDFEIIPSNADETLPAGTDPKSAVMTLSQRKADTVSRGNRDKVVIAADTIVVCDGEILGKPMDKQDAVRMLEMLSDNTHSVITGVSIIYDNMRYTFAETSVVHFLPLTDKLIDEYTDTDEPYDKAGAYAVQGEAYSFVKSIDGDKNNVIGLPVDSLKAALLMLKLY